MNPSLQENQPQPKRSAKQSRGPAYLGSLGQRVILQLLFLLLATSFSATVLAEESQATADEAMLQGEWEQALVGYLAMLQSAELNPHIHFNLGLAYTHLGQLTMALYHLTQAHYLEPGDNQIREAMELVRAEARSQRSPRGVGESITAGEPAKLFWFRFYSYLSISQVELAIIVFSWLSFGLLWLRRRTLPSGKRDALLVFAVLSLLLLAAAGWYRVGAEKHRQSVQPAVIMSDRPVLRQGPDLQAPRVPSPQVHGGSLVLIRNQRADWLEVEWGEGDSGWLRQTDIRPLRLRSARE